MNTPGNCGELGERVWIQSYMDLTGVTEPQARSVFMYVCCREILDADTLVFLAGGQGTWIDRIPGLQRV